MTIALAIVGVVGGLLAIEAVLTRIAARNSGRTAPDATKTLEACRTCYLAVKDCRCLWRKLAGRS